MEEKRPEILSIDSLKIGYASGKSRKLLIPAIYGSAYKGELIAVLGRNGIGKSTLLRTITGLQPSLGGNIFIDGRDIKEYSRLQLAKNIGYISTETVKMASMRVSDLVALGRFPHTNWYGKIDDLSHNIIIDSIEKTGMSDFYDRFISELSDGERQRAMIARALAQDADLMVMDEPTAFLDIRSKYEIIHLLISLTRSRGKTVIFSTHDFQMALDQADKIWLLLDNELIEGAPEDLFLKGSFDHLFDSSLVSFDPKNGSYILQKSEKGQIFVDGEGIIKQWTEKAVCRAGYILSDRKIHPYVKVPVEKGKNWILYCENSVNECESLYDLICFLITREKNLI